MDHIEKETHNALTATRSVSAAYQFIVDALFSDSSSCWDKWNVNNWVIYLPESEIKVDGNRIVGFALNFFNKTATFKVELRVRLKITGTGRDMQVATIVSGYSTQVQKTGRCAFEEYGPQASVPGAYYPWTRGVTTFDRCSLICPWQDVESGWIGSEATRWQMQEVFCRLAYFDTEIRANAKKKPRIRKASDQPTGTTRMRRPNPYLPMPRGRY